MSPTQIRRAGMGDPLAIELADPFNEFGTWDAATFALFGDPTPGGGDATISTNTRASVGTAQSSNARTVPQLSAAIKAAGGSLTVSQGDYSLLVAAANRSLFPITDNRNGTFTIKENSWSSLLSLENVMTGGSILAVGAIVLLLMLKK